MKESSYGKSAYYWEESHLYASSLINLSFTEKMNVIAIYEYEKFIVFKLFILLTFVCLEYLA